MATFVRLKRKRCEEPSDSLLVACKKGKTDDSDKNLNVKKEVFKRAGTVSTKDETQLKQAVYSYQSTRTDVDLSPACKNGGDNESSFYMDQSTLSQEQEELRRLFPQSSRDDGLAATDQQIEEIAKRQSAGVKFSKGQDVKVYDAVLNADKKVSLISGGLSEDPSKEEILCNGEVLTRITSDAACTSMDTEDEYVYDIFCLDQSRSEFNELYQEIDEIFTIEAYGEDFGPFAEYRTDQLYEDDDDDSNDEDNWRNDYPDEMDSEEEDDLFSEEYCGRAESHGQFGGLTLASSEDSSSGEDDSDLKDFETTNAEFTSYYKSYKRMRRGERDSESSENSYSDGYDDLVDETN